MALVGMGKVGFPGLDWPWLAAGPIVAGAVGGVVAGLRNRRSLLGAAGEVDRRLGLKDRLSTATAFGTVEAPADAFVRLALDEAEAASGSLDPRRAVPIVWGAAWRVWPMAAAAAVAIGVWAPSTDLWSGQRAREKEQARAREATARRLAEAMGPSRPETAAPLAVQRSAEKHDQNAVLEEIQRELASGKIDPAQAAARGAKELERVAAERDRQGEEASRARESVDEAIARMARSGSDNQAGSPLARALRDGDFAAASRAAKELLDAKPEQTAEERARTAAEMEQVVRDLRDAERARQNAARAEEHGEREHPDTRERPKGNDGPTKPPSAPDELIREIEDAAKDLRENRESPPPEPQNDGSRKPERKSGATPENKDPGGSEHRARDEAKPPKDDPAAKQPDSSKNEKTQSEGEPSSQAKSDPSSPDTDRKGNGGSETKADQKKEGEKPGEKSGEKKGGSESKPSGSPQEGLSRPGEQGERKGEDRKPGEKGGEQSSKGSSEPKPDQKDAAGGERGDDRKSGVQKSETKGGEPSSERSSERRPGDGGKDAAPKSGEERGAGDESGSKQSMGEQKPGEQSGQPAADGKTGARPAETIREKDGDQRSPAGEGAKESSRSGEQGLGSKSSNEPGTKSSPEGKPKGGSPDVKPTQGMDPPRPEGSTPNKDQQPNAAPGGEGAEPSKQGDGLRRLMDRLKKLSDAPQDAQAKRREAEDLRKRAEKMLPAQPEQMKRWGQDMAGRSGGGPLGDARTDARREASSPGTSKRETVDARPPTSAERAARAPERVIAEWYSNKKPESGDSGTRETLAPGAEQTVRDAARGGERAVEEQAVPGRFDKLLLRYFRRLPERAKADASAAPVSPPSSAKPTEPAQDAPSTR
jgi:hypothetical protein